MSEQSGTRIRVIRSAIGDGARLLDAVRSRNWLERACVLKSDPRCMVYAGAEPGGAGRIVVKVWRLSRAKDALNRALGRTQALRHWRGAEFLGIHGVRTAECAAVGRAGGEEILVMREIQGRSLLHHMRDIAAGESALTLPQRRALAHAAGKQVSALAALGVFNRDHKPSNLIVAEGADESPEIAIIDVVGLRRDRLRVGGLRMLTSLMLEPMGLGCAPSRTLRMRAMLAASGGAPLVARKAAWRAVAQAIEEHGDPTPKINPLAPPRTPPRPIHT